MGGGRLWYEGLDAYANRALGEDHQISWGDVPPGAALVSTFEMFSETMERLQGSLDSVDQGCCTLMDLRTQVYGAIDRRSIVERVNGLVYALTREWPQSLGRSPPRGGM